ncbi:MAG: pyrroline-5-carboxylate reductase [Candidatus Omnitrophica bacterium]|nr:pyrroline-5-carboxylate reductase [Candidatus Omnitrophota bacterium]
MRRRIGIIGCGKMGEAILSNTIKDRDFVLSICEKKEEIIKNIRRKFLSYRKRLFIYKDIPKLIENSEIIIIAVKPQDIGVVLEKISETLELIKKRPLFISIAAGITTSYLEKKIKFRPKIIRAMPNLAIKVADGITVLKRGHYITESDFRFASQLFRMMGKVIEIKKEKIMDVVTAISGSGPAYIAFIFEAISEAARLLGLDKEKSDKLILQTLLGTAKLLEEECFDTEGLISKVASKRGTTQEALKVFKKNKLKKIIIKAVISSFKRAKELSLS